MVRVALWVRLLAKQGKENEVAKFLEGALPAAQGETRTPVWFGLRLNQREFAIFDAFADDSARKAHLSRFGGIEHFPRQPAGGQSGASAFRHLVSQVGGTEEAKEELVGSAVHQGRPARGLLGNAVYHRPVGRLRLRPRVSVLGPGLQSVTDGGAHHAVKRCATEANRPAARQDADDAAEHRAGQARGPGL